MSAEQLRRWVLVIVGVALVGAMFFIAARFQQTDEHARRSVQILVECTTPGHACYNRSQKQTGSAILVLNENTISAAICARRRDVANDPESFLGCIQSTDQVLTPLFNGGRNK